MRKRIYTAVHVYDGSTLSVIYKWFMIFTIIISLIPLTVKESDDAFFSLNLICLIIYIVDFMLRWISADYKFENFKWSAFAHFPFRIISIIDLMSIFSLLLPMLGAMEGSHILKILKVFRIIRIFRYSKGIRNIIWILKKSKKTLGAVGALAVGYIFISALIIFNVEPESFGTFFDALYWSTISLTTVGYGDICPVSFMGRTLAMISAFFGIAIVALPAGIITAEYIKMLGSKD